MNLIRLLSAQPWVERLGLTLLHFLWQGVLITAVYAFIRRWMARSPNARYILACAALALMAGCPLITWSLLRPAADLAAVHFTAPISTAASAAPSIALRNVSPSFSAAVYRAASAPFLPWVVAIWIAGAMALWVRLAGGWLFAGRLRTRMVRPAPREWQQTLDRLKNRVRVNHHVRLLVSSLVQAPAVVGWLRPVVLMPVGALAGLPPEQIEALLLHELAHIRRHDYLVNVVQGIVETLLFYHPAVWWVSGHIRAERELCCDDVAVAANGDVLTYVRALAELEPARDFRAVMAATGGSLRHRVARLLGESRPAPRPLSGPGTIAAAILAAIILAAISVFAVFGQPVARPKFEVASIKPSLEQRFQMVRPLPGRLTADASLRLLMQNAYTVQPFQIVGLPAWTDSERYQIEAKADGNASRAQLFVMLQSLLEDRLQLKIHREARELPVYALVAAKSGLKLPPPKEGSCESADPDVPEWSGGRIAPPGRGTAPLARCGSVRVMLEMGGARMQGGKVSMPELIRVLSMVLDRSVVDKTGFTGLFDVRLAFLPDEITPALPAPPPDGSGAPVDSRNPSIVAALQEQLGLRIESTKGRVEVIVVDHVERPSAN